MFRGNFEDSKSENTNMSAFELYFNSENVLDKLSIMLIISLELIWILIVKFKI